jgi:hypothetical protein
MKKIFTILFVCFALQSFAQGNLQFNQVKTFTGNASGYIVLDTVPSGKVWKIESVAMVSNNSYFQIQWGGSNYFVINTSSGYSNLPFWLPSNTTVTFIASSATKVSIIEFNVVP